MADRLSDWLTVAELIANALAGFIDDREAANPPYDLWPEETPPAEGEEPDPSP